MAKTELKKRWVYQVKDGMVDSQIVTGETPAGWYDLIREAKLAEGAATVDEGEKSPVADKNVKDAKAEIATITDAETLQKIIDLDTRAGVTAAAQARLDVISKPE
jgi:hypothetical protein